MMSDELFIIPSKVLELDDIPDVVAGIVSRFDERPFTIGMFLRTTNMDELHEILGLAERAMINDNARLHILLLALLLANGEKLPVYEDTLSDICRRMLFIVQVELIRQINPTVVSLNHNTLTLESFNPEDYGFGTIEVS